MGTQRQEQSEHASQRLAALGEMTGGIAHDIRNLLSVIDTGLRLAEQHALEPEKLRSFISVSREAADRCVKLTSQLLGFAQQRLPTRNEEDINEMLRILQPFLHYAAGPGVRIVLDLTGDHHPCLVNRTQFEAAILNLVTNARDAMPGGGEIRVTTGRRTVESASPSVAAGEYLSVQVADGGEGMPGEVVQKVFDPFFTTKGEKGTGMGLPQVYAFMKRIGGGVRITSEPGLGTTIELLFPLRQGQQAPR